MNDHRGNLYLLTGLILGLVLGVLYSWVISPVKFVDTSPASMADNSKDEYRRLIALAYQAHPDLGRARGRLTLLDQDDAIPALAAQAQRMLSENQHPDDARALALLAAALGQPEGPDEIDEEVITPEIGPDSEQETPLSQPSPFATVEVGAAISTATAVTPTITSTAPPSPTATNTPVPSFTPLPTATPLPAQEGPYALQSRQEICDGSAPAGLLQVFVVDSEENPIPGVRITLTSQAGEEIFFTGLAPEISPGYADFRMVDGVAYSVKAGFAGIPVSNVQHKENCSLLLNFVMENNARP
jgi:hypothetical protein